MNHWLVNEEGAKNLNIIAQKYYKTVLNGFNAQNLMQYDAYTPWMGDLENRDKFKKLLFKTNKLLTSDNDRLKEINKHYSFPIKNSDIKIEMALKDKSEDPYYKAYEYLKNTKCIASLHLDSIIHEIVPVVARIGNVQNIGIGNSDHTTKGAIFISVPDIKFANIQLSINMAHEIGHQALMIYQNVDDIINLDHLDKPVYSIVRKTKRPAIQSFHALIANLYMIDFLRNFNMKNISKDEAIFINESKIKLEKNFVYSTHKFDNINFTKLGRDIFNEIINYVKDHGIAA